MGISLSSIGISRNGALVAAGAYALLAVSATKLEQAPVVHPSPSDQSKCAIDKAQRAARLLGFKDVENSPAVVSGIIYATGPIIISMCQLKAAAPAAPAP